MPYKTSTKYLEQSKFDIGDLKEHFFLFIDFDLHQSEKGKLRWDNNLLIATFHLFRITVKIKSKLSFL